MTEQTGNNKPNDAEALAFPLSGNEKLIEETAKAIHDVAMREYPGMPADIYGWDVQKDHDRDVYLLEARAALAVFEKAHTTTPPDGWFYMGSHVGAPWLNLEFSEEMDETGLPLWERPVQHTPTDDEREDMIAFLLRDHNFEESPWGRTYTDAEIANALRRSEVPEPSAEPKHDESCAEWCNHCQACGEGIRYGSRCREHYQNQPQGEPSDCTKSADSSGV